MAAIGTTRHSLTIVKSMTYRGAPEEWSNTYFFTGDLPSSPAHWKTMADAVIADEKTLYDPNVEVVRAIGHQAGQSIAVWSYDYEGAAETVPGTFTISTTAVRQGGDSASWIRWSTDALNSKGKPIYLRSYMHPAYAAGEGATSADDVSSAWATEAQAFGDAWITGYSDGTETHSRCGPHGAVGLVALPGSFVTTRTLERRGRRP